MNEIEDDDRYYAWITAIGLAIGSILLFALWAGFPLYNTIYTTNVRAEDNLLLDARYGIAWFTVLLLVGNILLPYLLLAVLVDKSNVVVADMHVILTYIMVILNALSFIGLTLFFFFGINTVYTGLFGLPFNDYRWCCVYNVDMPTLCPNVIPCDPDVVSTHLMQNRVFEGHWGFSIVFFILTLFHLMSNLYVRNSGVVTIDRKTVKASGRLLGVFYALIFVGVFIYWAAVPLYNTMLIYGYPRFSVPPSPNNFESWRYGWQFYAIFALVFNIVPIYGFLGALISNETKAGPIFFWASTVVMAIVDSIVLVYFILLWIFSCNGSWFGFDNAGSICNDYRWCCLYFADAPHLCANITPCPGSITLFANAEFVQHVFFAFVFILMNVVGLWVQHRMKVYKLFMS